MTVTLTSSARGRISQILATRTWLFGLGTGLSTWSPTSPPAEDTAATGLVTPLVYYRSTQDAVVIPDDDGVIQVNGQRFSLSAGGGHVYHRLTMLSSDVSDAVIREVGLFLAPDSLPDTQRVFTPSAPLNAALLMVLVDNLAPPITRNLATVETLEFVNAY